MLCKYVLTCESTSAHDLHNLLPCFKVFPSSRTPQLRRACELLLVSFVVYQLKVSLYDPVVVSYKTVGDEYAVCEAQILSFFVFFVTVYKLSGWWIVLGPDTTEKSGLSNLLTLEPSMVAYLAQGVHSTVCFIEACFCH